MRRVQSFDGSIDTADIPQEPRRIIAPVPQSKPVPLHYFVTAPESRTPLFRGDVTACTNWAQSEAVKRSAPFDVREATTGAVFFGFNAKGNFC